MNQLQFFGRRLRAVRKTAKLTQEGTAEKAHLNPKYLGQIERGEKRPSFDAVISLASALQVSPSLLFQFEQEGVDDRTLRRNIDALLHRCTFDQLRQVYKVARAIVEP
jgi:transcriptional regulator with XRE-family HTH domain